MWEGGWVTGLAWHRCPFLSQPASRDCPQLIHALGPNCYLHSGTEFAELRKVVALAPLGHWHGQKGTRPQRCQGKGWRLLVLAGTGSQDGMENRPSRAGTQGMG